MKAQTHNDSIVQAGIDELKEHDKFIVEQRAKRAAILLKHNSRPKNTLSTLSTLSTNSTSSNNPDTLTSTNPDTHPNDCVKEENVEVDMFADTYSDAIEDREAIFNPMPTLLLDSSDDVDGYYNLFLNEILHSQYKVTTNIGKGVFSTVVRAINLKFDQVNADTEGDGSGLRNFILNSKNEKIKVVAIKIIRNNSIMLKAGRQEISILKKLNESDLGDKMHIINLLDTFVHKSHLCLVFESQAFNLRQLLSRYGKPSGLSIEAVKSYATQLLQAATHLKNQGIVHADIKPENILISESKASLKLADFGSASLIGDTSITPYLVSRYYRAPEIILGLAYDYAIDIWSIGCTIYEIMMNRVLFRGCSNNQMLRLIIEGRGGIPKGMIKASSTAHFDGEFLISRETSLSGKFFIRRVFCGRRKSLRGVGAGYTCDLALDLLDRCLEVGPGKRWSGEQALLHPFITTPVIR